MHVLPLACVMVLATQTGALTHVEGRKDAQPETLKLLVSVEDKSITSPFPVRLTLHLHNSGKDTLWLYHRARDPRAPRPYVTSEEASKQTSGGASLEVVLQPEEIQGMSVISAPGWGRDLESSGLPHPKLVRLDPGEDYDEKTTIQLGPAMASSGGESKPIWGRYHLAITYRAEFSNQAEIARNLGLTLWAGEATSNVIEIELRPPPAVAQGSAAGAVVGPEEKPIRDVLVSLSDQDERLIDQRMTDAEGRFSFDHLPLSLYWLTARLPNSPTDTSVFRHLELNPSEPAGAVQVVMLPQEIYEPKQMLHKPVLFRLLDSAGRPLDKVALEVTWSSGTVLDNVKGQVSEDGSIALNLIPGRNYVTFKRHGCPKEEQRVDVAEGGGIDDFKLILDCASK